MVEKSQIVMSGSNFDEQRIDNVQRIADKTFYQRDGNWIDSEAANNPGPAPTDVAVGSPEFDELVDRLIVSNRQSTLALGENTIITEAGRQYRIVR